MGPRMYEASALRRQKPVKRERVVLADMRGDPWTEAKERDERERHAEDRAQAAADEDERGGRDD